MPSRAERRHHRDRVSRNRTRDYKAALGGTDTELKGLRPDLATRHPLDCGNPRCGLCHGDKVFLGGARRQAGKRELAREVALS
jgi:hypothetical protein